MSTVSDKSCREN